MTINLQDRQKATGTKSKTLLAINLYEKKYVLQAYRCKRLLTKSLRPVNVEHKVDTALLAMSLQHNTKIDFGYINCGLVDLGPYIVLSQNYHKNRPSLGLIVPVQITLNNY